MIVSIENWYEVLDQVLKLIIKLPGQYQLKKYMYFVNTMVELWSTKQYNILCRNLCGKNYVQ